MARLTLKVEYDEEENDGDYNEQGYYSDVTFSMKLSPSASIWSLYKAYAIFAKGLGYSTHELDKLYEE